MACVVAGLAQTVAAADVDGTYQLTTGSDCTRIGETDGALMIRDGVLYGVGTQCQMLNPLPVRNMAADLVDMRCQGGGTEWAERAMVMRSAEGGLILVWNGYAFTYPRCPEVAPLLPGTRPLPRPWKAMARAGGPAGTGTARPPPVRPRPRVAAARRPDPADRSERGMTD